MLEACCWSEAFVMSVTDSQFNGTENENRVMGETPHRQVEVFLTSRLTRRYWRERDGSLEEDDRRMV